MLLPAVLAALSGSPALADGLFQGLSLNGNADLYFRGDFTSGSRDAWQSSYWNTEPVRVSSGLDIEGPILGRYGLRAHIAQTGGWGYSENRLVLGYQGDNTAVLWGDLNVSVSGNEFASFQKTLKGWQVDHALAEGSAVRAFFSQEKGLVRSQTFQGNNTPGPYFLSYTPVVDGSEIIKVDELPMQFGTDYRLDYTTGQLYFEPTGKPPRIIPSTSVISISYQSATRFDVGATTYGGQFETKLLGDNLRLIGTALFLDRGGAGRQDTARVEEDPFPSAGSTGPFDVRFRPILDVPPNQETLTVIVEGREISLTKQDLLQVFVDDALQREGTDYDAIRALGRIIFRHIVPPTSLVRIRYYYDLRQTGEPLASQRVYGLVLRHQLSDSLSWSASTAMSQAGSGTEASGNATRFAVDFTGGQRLTASAEYRSMAPGFSYIESVGFRRNEKGLDLNLSYRPSQAISVTNRFSDVLTNNGYSFGYSGYSGGQPFSSPVSTMQAGDDTTSQALDVRSLRNDTQLHLNVPGWPTLTASHQLFRNSGGSRGDSTMNSTGLGLSWAPTSAPVTFSTQYHTNTQSYLGLESGGSGTQFTPRASSTSSLTTAASWTPSESLGLTGSWGHNQSKSGYQDQRGESDTVTFAARWRGSDSLSASADVSSSSSVGAVASGFYGTPGGYGGQGGIGGIGGIGGLSTLGVHAAGLGAGVDTTQTGDLTLRQQRYDDLSARLHLEWSPTETLRLSGDVGKRRYTSAGTTGYLADSDQRSGQVSLYWQASQAWAVNLGLSSDLLQYLQPGRGGVLSNSLILGVMNRPLDSPLSWSLSLVDQWGVSPDYEGTSQKATLVDTSLFDVRASAQYRLSETIDGFGSAEYSDFAGGFSDFGKISAELGLRYKLSEVLGLDLSWQFVSYNSRLGEQTGGTPGLGTQSQDYTNHTIMVRVSSAFRSAIGGPTGSYAESGIAGTSTGTWGRGFGTGFGGGFSGGLGSGLGSGSGSGGFGSSFNRLGGRSYGGYDEFGTLPGASFGGTGESFGGLGPGWGGPSRPPAAGFGPAGRQGPPPGDVADPWRDLRGDEGRPLSDDQRDV